MANRFTNALAALRVQPEPEAPRGVTVYTLVSAEHYPIGDAWSIDEQESVHVYDVSGYCIATFLHGTWVRLEVGAPPDEPIAPAEATE